MGRKKVKDWQPNFQKKPIDYGLQYAIQMANYQMKVEKATRWEMAKDKLTREIVMENKDEVENWLWASFALALYRKFGFDAEKIVSVFEAAQDIHNGNVESGCDDKELWQLCENEIGLKLEEG